MILLVVAQFSPQAEGISPSFEHKALGNDTNQVFCYRIGVPK
jgi:hypothetical protein